MMLAAGLGTRLWPLTADRAKPAVPFLGRPLVAHALETLLAHGFRRLVVNTHHCPASIERALEPLRAEAHRAGATLHLRHEPDILGTAGGIAAARDEGLIDAEAPLLIFNAKLYTDADLSELWQAHEAFAPAVTMLLRPNTGRAHFREVFLDEGRVVGFGASRAPESSDPVMFTGIQVLSPEVLAGLSPRFSDTVRDVYPPLIELGAVRGHTAHDFRWWEFSTLSRYLEHHLTARRLGLEAIGSHPDCVLWDGARIDASADVKRCILGADVHILAGETIRDAAIVRRDVSEHWPEGTRYWEDRVVVPIAPPA